MKDILGYEGLYKATKSGKIWSSYYNRYLGHTQKHRYVKLVLVKDGDHTPVLAHRLIAVAFIPNPENKPHINHKNGVKSDNRVENLEWCTNAENVSHAHKTKLIVISSGKDNHMYGRTGFNSNRKRIINQIDNKTGKIVKTWGSIRVAGKESGYSRTHIQRHLRGVGRQSPYGWEYKNPQPTKNLSSLKKD